MSFFDYSTPLIRCKNFHAETYADQDLRVIGWQIGRHYFYSNVFTGADRACLTWALFVSPIFLVGQFLPVDWTLQAMIWTSISLAGVSTMMHLAKQWARRKCVTWLLYCWSVLICSGLILTNLGIFLNWGRLLANLCPLWLGLCGIGYLCTGLALHSRAFIATSCVHYVAIGLLPYVSGFQFLFTGVVMVFFLLLLAEFQWDMRTRKTTQP